MGFSLVELLVATAIMSVVLAGLAAVFAGSIRAVRQGYRMHDSYEMARGAFATMERDVTTAFTARDRGDYYNFFGTPRGFTFVGVAGNYQGPGANPDSNMSRITYVIRRNAAGDFTDIDGNPVRTYQLIRYVERNVSDLSSFPVDWRSYMANPEFQARFSELNVEAPQGGAINFAVDYYNPVQPLDDVTQELVRAKMRELWIDMLAEVNGVPSAWNVVLPATYGRLFNPDDYVVAENVVLDRAWVNMDGDTTFDAATDPEVAVPWFIYGTVGNPASPPQNFEWIWLDSDGDGTPNLDIDGDGVNDQGYRVPVFRFLDASSLFVTPYYATPPTPLFDSVRFVASWNSRDNISDASLIGAGNQQGLIPLQGERAWTDSDGRPRGVDTTGSPVKARLPHVINVRLPFKFPSPGAGAPDMTRLLDDTIDLPTAFQRPVLGLNQ